MGELEWLNVPVGIDRKRWMTREVSRRVLVVAHTVVSLQRLLDVIELVESDPRVQVVFTQGPDVFHHGVDDVLRAVGAVRVSWHQAVQERFDLALFAAYGGLTEVHAPIMVMPHGAGYAKRTPPVDSANRTAPSVYGLGSEHLVSEGRVVPASIVLAHESQRDLLRLGCPEALDVAIVAGDPCYDRLVADMSWKANYRVALRVRPDQELVTISSTWGQHSLFRRYEDLPAALLAELNPQRFRIAALLHPGVWSGHGRRQIRAWLSEERTKGLLLVPPEAGWRAVVAASDYVIGDHGSVPAYALSVGVPVLRTAPLPDDIGESSAQWLVRTDAPQLVRAEPLGPQLLRASAETPTDLPAAVAARLTSRPGQAHRILREEIYRLMDLDVPGRHRAVEPDPVPEFAGARHVG
jgi:hypothetical protein